MEKHKNKPKHRKSITYKTIEVVTKRKARESSRKTSLGRHSTKQSINENSAVHITYKTLQAEF